MIHPDPRVESLMLADLGAHLLGAIAATMTLGHSRLAHTAEYGDTSADPSASLVRAVVRGEIGAVRDALERWGAEEAERWASSIEEAGSGPVARPERPPTALDFQRAAMERAMPS